MAPFSFATLYLLINTSRWNVVLELDTLLVIVGGSLCFLLGNLFVSLVCGINKGNRKEYIEKTNYQNDNNINISKVILIIGLGVELFCLLYCLKAIISVVHRYGHYGNLSYLIYKYRNLNIYTTENISLGSLGDLFYSFATSIGYVWGNIFVKKILYNNKIDILLLLNIIISLITCLIKGGRQSAIQMILACFVMYLMLYLESRKVKKIPIKKLIKYILIGMGGLASFQVLGSILGRTVQADFNQYLAVYFAGGIRNLNEYLKGFSTKADVFGKMSFIYLNNYIGNKFHNEKLIYPLDLPYLSANGHNSGNIYTTFYAYIYDFGYIGVVILPLIMGAISMFVFTRVKRNITKKQKLVNLSLILYGYMFYLLFFSFFSNKFYEGILSLGFFKRMFIWIVATFLLNHIEIKGTKVKFSIRV